jgi:hypothetical protein
MIKWFAANKLDKANMMKFIMNNLPYSALYIDCEEKCTEEPVNTKYLGSQIDNHLSSKNHIEQMVSKFSGACYAVMSVFHISSITTLKSIYFAYFHSIMK